MSKADLVNKLDSLSEGEFQAVISNSKKHRKFLKQTIEGMPQKKFCELAELYRDAQQPKVTRLEFSAKFQVRIIYAWKEDLEIYPSVGVKVILDDGTPCKENMTKELPRGVMWEELAKKVAGESYALLLAKQTKVVEEIQKVSEELELDEEAIWEALNEYLDEDEDEAADEGR